MSGKETHAHIHKCTRICTRTSTHTHAGCISCIWHKNSKGTLVRFLMFRTLMSRSKISGSCNNGSTQTSYVRRYNAPSLARIHLTLNWKEGKPLGVNFTTNTIKGKEPQICAHAYLTAHTHTHTHRQFVSHIPNGTSFGGRIYFLPRLDTSKNDVRLSSFVHKQLKPRLIIEATNSECRFVVVSSER